jgi:hypothetical protein
MGFNINLRCKNPERSLSAFKRTGGLSNRVILRSNESH